MDQFGPFRLLARLGAGGMGEVWKAEGPGDGGAPHVLVVKRILTHLATEPEMERSFLREVRLSERLRHDNIVRVFGGGRVGDAMYLTMEYLDGVDLHRLLRAMKDRGMTPPVGLGAAIARDVARGLAHAYSAPGEDGLPLRLVHRDVTPTNIMITRDGRVKLLDFGLAKALSEVSDALSNTGTLKGKFGYMSPEQIDGGAARHASDQFSLGVVLHETLLGERLFRGEHDIQTIANVKNMDVVRPSHVQPAVPAALDAICLRALSRDPRGRFRDCAALADALDPVVADLGMDAAQLSSLVRELFPSTAAMQLALPDAAPARATAIRAPRPAATTRRRWWPLAAMGAIALAGTVAWRAHDASRIEKSDEVAPVSAPPAATIVMPASTPPSPAPRPPSTPPVAEVVADSPAPAPAPLRAKATRSVPKTNTKPRTSAKPATPATKSANDAIRQGAVVDPFAR